jgi:hypothetical protein
MKLICGTGTSFIDLCSYEARLTRRLPFADRTYVDISFRNLDNVGPGEQDKFVQADVLGDHPVFNRRYDVAICSDGIEHLTKEQGWKLLERMKQLADRQVLFTPLHAWMMDPTNPAPESHKSLWTPEDLPDWAHISVPEYHPTLGIGAFFFWNCPNLDEDWKRVAKNIRDVWN